MNGLALDSGEFISADELNAKWLPRKATEEEMSKEQPESLPVRLAKRLCDGISTGHDWPNTDDELLRMQSAAEMRRLHAENEALRAQIGQGVPDGWQLVPKEPTEEMQTHAMSYVYVKGFTRGTGPAAVYAAMLASAPPAPQAAGLQHEPLACAQVVSMNDVQGVVEWLPHHGKPIKVGDFLYSAPQQKPLTDEHVTDGSKCWCDPELNYKDPDTGVEVLVHRSKQ